MTTDPRRASSQIWIVHVVGATIVAAGAFAYSQLLRANRIGEELTASNAQVLELRGAISDLQSRVKLLEHTTSRAPGNIALDRTGVIPGSGTREQESTEGGQTVSFIPGDGDSNASSSMFIVRGNEKMKLRDYAGAESDYREAMKVDPDSANIIASVGVAQTFQNHIPEAVHMFEQSLQLRPNALAFAELGRIRYQQKQYAEAYRLTQAALEKRPTLELALWQMALIYDALGQRESALRTYKKYADLYPDSNGAIYARNRLENTHAPQGGRLE